MAEKERLLEKKTAVICDLDGTLCNIDHRRPLLDGEKKHWSEFFEKMVDDSVNDWCRQLIYSMADDPYNHIIFVTGRPANFKAQTLNWLRDNVQDIQFQLHMRKEGDYRKDWEVKRDIYMAYIKPEYDVMFVVDDRKQVVDMWRREGLVCLQCAEGNY